MARKSYFDLIGQMGFDEQIELNNLMNLLKLNKYFDRHYSKSSLNDAISENFLSYPNRSTFTSYGQMLEFISRNTDSIIEQLFVFAELLVDIFNNIWELFTSKEQKFIDVVLSNIDRFLELSNHEFVEIEDGRHIIVEKSVYASQASQIVSETNIQDAIKVLEYNHFANKGNIQRKKEILISLANYLEPLRTELNSSNDLKDVLKVQNNKIIALEKVFEMYNSFGLRHINDKQLSNDMSSDELEQWYDDIYSSTLFVILAIDESRILTKLNELKTK